MADNELDRVLRQQFPGPRRGRKQSPSLGGVPVDFGSPDYTPNTEGQVPGLVYAGGQPSARADAARALDPIFSGIDLSKCPPWMNAECIDLFSRMLEQTFRNFQLASRLPSHISPPFQARGVDKFTNAAVVASAGAPGAFVDLVSFTMPLLNYRGVIVAAGQAVENPVAWGFLEWRILLDGIPLPEYTSIRVQLWQFVPPTPLIIGVLLKSGQTIKIQVRNNDPVNPYTAFARMIGWYYPVRAETGDTIRSTIVD